MKIKKSKLAIFTGSDLRNFGGGEKYIIELCKRLKDFDITVFSYEDEKSARLSKSEIKTLLKTKLEFFRSFTIPILKERVPFSFSGLKVLSKLNTFDSIYITDPSIPTIFMILMFLKLKKAKTKLIFGAHDPGFLRAKPQKNNIFRKILLRMYKPIQYAVLFKIPNIHVLNSFDLKLLKKLGYNGNIYYIPNFLYYKKNNKIKSNKKDFVVLFGGRLSIYHKGLDFLIKIIDKTIKRNKNIKFHIFGSGEDGQKLIEELSNKYPNNAKYLGFLSNDQVENEYLNASLYIMTSRIEAFSLVTLEAQAHGLPVIAFDIKGPHDIIKNDFQGKLIEPFKMEDFVKAILYYYKLWRAGRLSENYKRQIIDYIFNNYSDKKIVLKLEKMLMNQKKQ